MKTKKKFMLFAGLILISSCSRHADFYLQRNPVTKVSPCTEDFLYDYGETKMALRDWHETGDRNYGSFAQVKCINFLRYYKYDCKMDCERTGTVTDILCPDRDGEMINGDWIKNECHKICNF